MNEKASLKKKAEACLAKKVDIPMSPLWHMGRAAKFGSENNFEVMQEAVDYLTCKARTKMAFNADDKEFLKELYEAFWWGGHYTGLKESAQLANHYVNGNGLPLRIKPEVYQTSKIVIATMAAMKAFIAEPKTKSKNLTNFRCDQVEFRQSHYSAALRRMNYMTEGMMLPSGVLQAAQNNQRLHKTDGHFYLGSFNTPIQDGTIKTTWSVKSIYDFEPFEKENYYSIIPLGKHELELYDGLSEYMTRIGVAKVFHYSTEWQETWSISS